jgi:hypothetical protein
MSEIGELTSPVVGMLLVAQPRSLPRASEMSKIGEITSPVVDTLDERLGAAVAGMPPIL